MLSVEDIEWSPPEWTLCGFPLETAGQEPILLAAALDTLHRLADTITDADSTALGPAMHVAHMLVSRQGADGQWPAAMNARTGDTLSGERTDAPLRLYERLANILGTTEFDRILTFAGKQKWMPGR